MSVSLSVSMSLSVSVSLSVSSPGLRTGRCHPVPGDTAAAPAPDLFLQAQTQSKPSRIPGSSWCHPQPCLYTTKWVVLGAPGPSTQILIFLPKSASLAKDKEGQPSDAPRWGLTTGFSQHLWMQWSHFSIFKKFCEGRVCISPKFCNPCFFLGVLMAKNEVQTSPLQSSCVPAYCI